MAEAKNERDFNQSINVNCEMVKWKELAVNEQRI